jgi:autotransporter-associated beta strand protein
MMSPHRPSPSWATLAALGLLGWLLGAPEASGQLRIANYNVTASSSSLTSPRPGMDTVLAAIGSSAKGGFSRPIDVLVLLEANTVGTTGVQFATLLNTIYGGTNYRQSALDGGSTGAGRPIAVYNAATVSLVNETGIGITSSTGQPRQTLRYQFQPVGYDSTAGFTVYASHFKASNSSSDAARRNVEARAIRADLDALGEGVNAIQLGDLNLYTSSDPSFQTLTGTGPGQFFDPVNSVGSWTGNSAFRAVHTQSPASTTAFPGQVLGGINDRFDFQLTTGELLDGRGMDSVTSSYWAFGNTNTHTMGGAVTTGSPAALAAVIPGTTTTQASSVLTALSQVTDHLPVVSDYQLPARMSASLTGAPTTVIKGAAVSGLLTVANSAPVAVVAGADRLDYSYAGTGVVLATGTGSDAALGSSNTHAVALNTAAAGLVSGTLTVQATSPQASSPTFSQAVTLSVLDNAIGSFAAGSTVSSLDINFGTLTQGSGTSSQAFGVFNRAGSLGTGWTARLDLDSVTPTVPAAVFATTLAPFGNLASGSSRSYAMSMLTTTSGSFAGTYSLAVSDEDLPGATARTMTITVRGSVVTPANAVLNVPSGSQTQLAVGFAAITGTAAVTKTGTGTVVMGGSNTFTGPTTVQQGTLTLTATQSLGGSSSIGVAAGATLDARSLAGGLTLPAGRTISGSGGLRGAITLAGGTLGMAALTVAPAAGLDRLTMTAGALANAPALTVSGSGVVTLPLTSPALVNLRSLQVATGTGGGKLDVGTSLVTVAAGGLSATDLVTALTSGRNGGLWDGSTGITSSRVATDVAGGLTRAVGWIDNGAGGLTFGYAASGDTNLDGGIDILDMAAFMSAGKYESGLAAIWAEGDFNYDGLVDLLDAADFLSTGLFDAGGYNAASGSIVAVPEPQPLAWLGIAAGLAMLLARPQARRHTAKPSPCPAGS